MAKRDATGKIVLSSIQKCTAAVGMLAYELPVVL
jgi:hypothetical protein